MKTIEIEIPDGHRAEWVNGVLTLVEDKPIEYKFKVGDKVKITTTPDYCAHPNAIYEITELMERNGEPLYKIEYDGASYRTYERNLELAPQDITERIKTFEDAYDWCNARDNRLTLEYERIKSRIGALSPDILAYLKLRIITAALNEGWEPTYEMGEYGELDKNIFVPDFGDKEVPVIRSTSIYGDSSAKLCFKSEDLAKYAAKQFRDIYADFCGCKKGGEQ